MQIDSLTIPDEWCSLLTDLQKTDPAALLAGGAVRDLFLGHLPKDLDFFTLGPLPNWDNPVESGMDYEGMKYVQAVASYNLSLPVNVVLIDLAMDHMSLLNSFDFGICQIGFDGQRIIKTPAFDWDYKHGLMSLRHTDRYLRSIMRYNRIGPRIGMKLSIPALETKVA